MILSKLSNIWIFWIPTVTNTWLKIRVTKTINLRNVSPALRQSWLVHDDVFKWKPSPRYWPFLRAIHPSPVNSPHKGQWRGVLMFSLTCAWINGWVNNREADDLRLNRAHYDVIVMITDFFFMNWYCLWIRNSPLNIPRIMIVVVRFWIQDVYPFLWQFVAKKIIYLHMYRMLVFGI